MFAVDCVAARYMGLDPDKIRYLHYFLDRKYDGVALGEISVCENGEIIENFFTTPTNYLDFHVVDQWKGIKYLQDHAEL